MARFYGTIQGARGPASRLGHKSLEVTAQSYQGDVIVEFVRGGDKYEVDIVTICAAPHVGGQNIVLYRGPIHDLLTEEGRGAIVRQFAHDALERENKRAK